MKTIAAVRVSLYALGAGLFSVFDCYGQVTISQSVQNDTSRPLLELVATAPAPLAPVSTPSNPAYGDSNG
jgi:hypothetical protein